MPSLIYDNVTNLAPNKLRVMLDADGGTLSSIDKVVAEGDTYGYLPIPEKEG